MEVCLLCQNPTALTKTILNGITFLKCDTCFVLFKHPQHFVTTAVEKKRYLKHVNDVTDRGYQKFVSPMVNAIFAKYSNTDIGLDFGAGTGPVVSKLLSEKGYITALYDPFFHPETTALQKKYDYIICCEVIEHFYDPNKEFQLLKNLLKDEGTLFCMTELVPEEIPFKDWHYKNDCTHVVFYTEKTTQWIKKKYGFTQATINGRLISFSN